MDIKHSSCCDMVEQKVNFWLTNSGELVIESELLRRKEMNEFFNGVVCLGLVVILFLLADYLEINSFKELF